MKTIVAACAAISVLLLQVQAYASKTITFESLPIDPADQLGVIPNDYYGLTWSNIRLFSSSFQNPAYNAIGNISAWTADNGGWIYAAPGSTFKVTGLAMLPTYAWTENVYFTGYIGDAVVYNSTFSTWKMIDESGKLSYSKFILDTGNITKLFINSANAHQVILDNIVVDGTPTSSVPIPSAVWLLGAGLAGVAGLRKRISQHG